MNFGVQVEPQFGYEFGDILGICEKSLDSGFSTLWFSDHFMLNRDATDKVLLDPWLVMSALVRENIDIRVGSLVFCNSYRHPPLHAKMGATLDVLSSGRLEFGIGAGWKEIEYDAYGYDFPSDDVRIEQLAEAIQIIRGVWTEDRFSFAGEHYSVKDLVSFPKPVQEPHPTIWVGTMKGKEKMLRVTAQFGDGINLAWAFSPERCNEVFSRLNEYAESYGRNPSMIKRSVGLWTRMFETEAEMESMIRESAKKRGVTIDDYRERVSSALWGTPEMIVDRLKEYASLDVSDIIFMFPYGEEEDYIEKFGNQIISKVA